VKRIGLGFIAVWSLFLLGCASWTVPKPGNITLEDALESVGRGLVQMKKAELEANEGKDFKTGLLASEAEVTFNISAAGSQGGKLYVEVTPLSAIGAGSSGRAGAEASTEYKASRGNQITIKFRNVAFSKTTADGKIIDGPTDPETLKKVVGTLDNAGITTFGNKPKPLGDVNDHSGP
jgi:hypothetical protein